MLNDFAKFSKHQVVCMILSSLTELVIHAFTCPGDSTSTLLQRFS